MDAATFVAGFASCLSILLFLLLAALLLSTSGRDRVVVAAPVAGNGRMVAPSRREIEIAAVRVHEHQEMQVKRLLLEAGYTFDTRAVNGNRLVDITYYRVR